MTSNFEWFQRETWSYTLKLAQKPIEIYLFIYKYE